MNGSGGGISPVPAGKPIVGLAFEGEEAKDRTGGELYNSHLYRGWNNVAEVRFLKIRHRWFLCRLHGLALLLQHLRVLWKCDWVVQDASSIFRSRFLIHLLRLLRPRVRHLGIIHHPRWSENSGHRRFEEAFFNDFDQIITVSRHIEHQLRQAGVSRPISILPPGASLNREYSRDEIEKRDDLVMWSGHLFERKGPHILLEALALLPGEPSFHAVLVAAGQKDPEFEKKIEMQSKTGILKERVRLLDRLPDGEYFDLMKRAGIFCLPSGVEGYSIATAQAMSWGCAILVPRTANFIELIGDESYPGLFNLEDAGDLARILGEVLGNRSVRDAMVSATMKRAGELYTWEEFESAGARLFEKIAAG